MSKIKSLRGYSYIVISAILGFSISLFLDYTFDNTPPIRYLYGGTDTKEVYQGGKIEVRFRVIRNRECKAEVSRYITDESGISTRVSEYEFVNTTKLGDETYDRIITVPAIVNPGKAFYQLKINYYCNWYQKIGYPITIISPKVYFTVLKAPEEVPTPVQSQ